MMSHATIPQSPNALTLSEVEGSERVGFRSSNHAALSFDFAQDERRGSAAR